MPGTHQYVFFLLCRVLGLEGVKVIDFSNRLVIGTQPVGLGEERMDSQVGENLCLKWDKTSVYLKSYTYILKHIILLFAIGQRM